MFSWGIYLNYTKEIRGWPQKNNACTKDSQPLQLEKKGGKLLVFPLLWISFEDLPFCDLTEAWTKWKILQTTQENRGKKESNLTLLLYPEGYQIFYLNLQVFLLILRFSIVLLQVILRWKHSVPFQLAIKLQLLPNFLRVYAHGLEHIVMLCNWR